MIFYFTGTGNSLDAAMQVACDDELINITECVQKKAFRFSVSACDCVGFVFPVYFAGLPSIVSYFVNHLKLEGHPAYLFAVITCGGDMFGAGGMLAEDLKKKGYMLDAVYQVEMPDNYILMYEPDSDVDRAKTLEESRAVLAGIKKEIDAHTLKDTTPSAKAKAITKMMYPMYVRGRMTKKFWVDDQCIGCGTCAHRCPVHAIEMKDGKPTWVKERCVQCMACLRCGAVQYGKKTVGRSRYTNPVLKKKSCHSAQ